MGMKAKKRIRIEVVPARVWASPEYRAVRGWVVRVDGAHWLALRGKNNAMYMAVVEAGSLEARGGTVELYIRNRAGKIVDRRTYPRSSDPRRSKG